MHFLEGYVSRKWDQIQQQTILAQKQVYKQNHAAKIIKQIIIFKLIANIYKFLSQGTISSWFIQAVDGI